MNFLCFYCKKWDEHIRKAIDNQSTI